MTRAKDISKIITDADFSGTLDVTGDLTVGSGTNATISLDSNSAFDASISTDGSNQALNITATNNSSNGNVYIKTGGTGTPLTRARFEPDGDISFYEDTGTTPKLFWDASAESLGIGTSSPDVPLEISVAGSSITNVLKLTTTSSGTVPAMQFEGDSGGTQHIIARVRAQQDDASNGGIVFETENSGSVAERMRIDSSGNLLVGATSSNSGAFGAVSPQILVAGSIPQVALHETDTDKDGYIGISSSTMFIQTADSIPIRFGTSDAERMRIDSGGVTHFGGTSSINDATGAGSVNITSLSTALEVYRTSTGGNTICQMFSNEGSTKSNRFGFKANGGLSNYSANDTNLSDEREKTDIELSKDYLAIINAIPVKTFKYIDHSSDEPSLGVIAQDVQAVAPELVNEEDWGTIENPKIRLSVFTTDMQFAMMKAIQELSAKNDALETANTALEARITALETA